MADETLPDPQELSYEAARDELITIVRQLESGQAPLEATLKMWERGEALASRCRSVLEAARARLRTSSAPQTGEAD